MERECEHCGKIFIARQSVIAKGDGRFCSTKCCGDSRRNRGKPDAWRYLHRDGRWYRFWREQGSRYIHRQLESRWVWEMANGPIAAGCEIHHINHDPTDNRIENLRHVTAEEHREYHQSLRTDHRVGLGGIEERRCQRCKEYKPLDGFYRRTAGTFGGYCKQCSAQYLREWKRRRALQPSS